MAASADAAHLVVASTEYNRYSRAALLVLAAVSGHNPDYDASTPETLRVGRILATSGLYHAASFVVSVCLLGVGIFEQPATYGPDNATNAGSAHFSPLALAVVELVLVLLVALDLRMVYKHLGRARFAASAWPKASAWCVAISIVNILLCLAWPNCPRVYRFMRPVMVLAHFTNVREIFGNMARSVWPVAKVFMLLLFHIAFCAVLAFFLFAGNHYIEGEYEPDGVTLKLCCGEPECADVVAGNKTHPVLCSPFSRDTCSDYFGRVPSAFNELFTLITTANFPDVMMPAYACSPWASLFFVYFLSVGLFFIMNLVLAVVYSSFTDSTKEKVLQAVAKRVRAADAAFRILSQLSSSGEGSDAASVEDDAAAAGVTPIVFYRLLVTLRGSLPKSDWGARELEIAFRTVNSSGSGVISRDEFRNIAHYVQVRIARHRQGSAEDYAALGSTVLRLRQAVRPLVMSPKFTAVFDALVYVTGILVFVELFVSQTGTTFTTIDKLLEVVLWLFVVEVSLRWFGVGSSMFFADAWNWFDLLIVYPSAAFDAYELTTPEQDNLSRQLAFLRLLRLLRTLRSLKGFTVIIKSLTVIAPFFARYLAVSLLIFYAFAILGMELFAGRIEESLAAVAASPYGQSQYWQNNFNSLPAALVTLFELVVVNNWSITEQGYVAATSAWAMVYFIGFFCVGVIVLCSIVTAFLIDDFDVSFSSAGACSVSRPILTP